MTEHDLVLMIQRQRAALIAERDALRLQVAALAEERDALQLQVTELAGYHDALRTENERLHYLLGRGAQESMDNAMRYLPDA